MRMRRRRLLRTMAALALAIASPALAASDGQRASAATLVARGNEPFWRLSVGPSGLDIASPNPELAFRAGRVTRTHVGGQTRLQAVSAGRRVTVTVSERLCVDTMTGMPFPASVRIAIDGRRLSGCGGETIDALKGGWRVIRLGGKPLPPKATATIAFGRDGRASGNSGCNRFTGPFRLTGEGLSFGPLATTRMACPPPQMQVEQRFLQLIGKVTGVTPGRHGQLSLTADGGEALLLDRLR